MPCCVWSRVLCYVDCLTSVGFGVVRGRGEEEAAALPPGPPTVYLGYCLSFERRADPQGVLTLQDRARRFATS